MDIVRTDTGDLTATIKIELKADDYLEKVEKELKNIQKKVSMPGFRPGKVPSGLVKKMYGKSAKFDEVNSLLTDAINNYITENKLNILGTPLVSRDDNMDIDWDNPVDISFYFQLGFAPEFDIDFDKLPEITNYKIVVDEKVLDNVINSMRKKFGNSIEVESSEDTDLVNFDFSELDENGNILQDGITGNTMLSPQYLKNDKDLFIGVKPGDEVVFNPKKIVGDNIAEISGMLNIDKEKAEILTSDFKAVITTVKRTELAEINEEFFTKAYPYKKVENIQELRDIFSEDAAKTFNNESRQTFDYDVKEMLKKEIKFDLPHEFLKLWLKDNADKEIDDETLEREYPYYENSLRMQLIENKIITKYDINVGTEDLKDYVKKTFLNRYSTGQNDELAEDFTKHLDEIANTVLKNEEEARKVREKVFEEKLFDLYSTSLKIVEKEVTYEEFIKFVNEK